MKLLSKKIVLLLFASIIMGISLLVFVNYTDACRLKKVRFNNKDVDSWQTRYGLDSNNSILKQPLDSLAQSLIKGKSVFKVDIKYSLLHGIDINTNNFSLVSFLQDKKSGKTYGLNEDARIISLNNCDFTWEHPVLTTTSAANQFNYCDDVRIKVIIDQLKQLRNENVDLYRLIEEIDFGNVRFLQVSIAGLPYRLKVRAGSFLENLDKFVEFVSRFEPDLNDVTLLDLRYDEMIICTGRIG